MARRYSATALAAAAANTSILGLTSTTTIRPRLFEIEFGSPAAPADQAMDMWCQRYTAAGTSTGLAEVPDDPADPASACAAGEDHSAEPTYTSALVPKAFAINQQATYRWQVLPEFGIVLPGTAANGIGMRWESISGGTPACRASFRWEE